MFIRIFAPFLFWAPYVHQRALQTAWVDGVLHHSIWEEAMKKLNDEWQEFVFLVCLSIVVNLNMVILTIFLGNGVAACQRGIPSYSIRGQLGSTLFVRSSERKLPLHSCQRWEYSFKFALTSPDKKQSNAHGRRCSKSAQQFYNLPPFLTPSSKTI